MDRKLNLLRQLLISLVVLVAVAAGYVYFVPGASDTLASFGIKLPFGPAPSSTGPAQVAGNAASPAGGRQGGAAGGGRAAGPGGAYGRVQTPTVITAPVVFSTIDDKLVAIGE